MQGNFRKCKQRTGRFNMIDHTFQGFNPQLKNIKIKNKCKSATSKRRRKRSRTKSKHEVPPILN